MPHFYRGGNSRRYRGSEEQSSQDGEGKRTVIIAFDSQNMILYS